MLSELNVSDMELDKCSWDEKHIEYERYFIKMGSTRIGHSEWPTKIPIAKGFTYFPHRHGASTVDYVMA